MSEEIIKKLKEHDKRFDAHDKRFDAHDEQFDLIARTVVDHTERLDRIERTMVTKQDWERLIHTQDEITVILKRLDQERVFTFEHVKRLERELTEQRGKIEEHDSDLRNIKLRLQIA